MFHNGRPLAGIVPFRGASVPSIGGTPSLASAFAAVERAESVLAEARSAARAAAKREGKPTTTLFGDGRFIARASAEKWCEQARSEGKHEGHREAVDAMFIARGLDPAKERAEIAASLERDRKASRAREARWKALMKDAGFFEACDAEDYEKAGRIAAEMHPVLTKLDAHALPRSVVEQLEQSGKAKATAEGILAAGKRARMSADAEVPAPANGTFAARVILAGKRRRGEIE
jgi:hypothetical protein